MRIEVTKEFVGKTIFAIPTGNNAKRGKERQDIEEFEVISFARKYMTVKRVNGYQEISMCPKTGATQEAIRTGYGGNAGYFFFASYKDAENFQLEAELRSKAYKLLSNFNSTSKLSIDTIHKIIEELESE